MTELLLDEFQEPEKTIPVQLSYEGKNPRNAVEYLRALSEMPRSTQTFKKKERKGKKKTHLKPFVF